MRSDQCRRCGAYAGSSVWFLPYGRWADADVWGDTHKPVPYRAPTRVALKDGLCQRCKAEADRAAAGKEE